MPSPQSLALCRHFTGTDAPPPTTERAQAPLVMKGSRVRVPSSASEESAASCQGCVYDLGSGATPGPWRLPFALPRRSRLKPSAARPLRPGVVGAARARASPSRPARHVAPIDREVRMSSNAPTLIGSCPSTRGSRRRRRSSRWRRAAGVDRHPKTARDHIKAGLLRAVQFEGGGPAPSTATTRRRGSRRSSSRSAAAARSRSPRIASAPDRAPSSDWYSTSNASWIPLARMASRPTIQTHQGRAAELFHALAVDLSPGAPSRR